MIEARQERPHAVFRIYDGKEELCTVSHVIRSANGWIGPDWPATRKRAEHIAEALRHYQQSQEGVRVP